MSGQEPTINLQFCNDTLSYQHLISFMYLKLRKIPDAQIMPSSRGSQSEISGT